MQRQQLTVKVFEVEFISEDNPTPKKDTLISLADSLGKAEMQYLSGSRPGTVIQQLKYVGNAMLSFDVEDAVREQLRLEAEMKRFEPIERGNLLLHQQYNPDNVWICDCGWKQDLPPCKNCNGSKGVFYPKAQLAKE